VKEFIIRKKLATSRVVIPAQAGIHRTVAQSV
jgi:hypothetical protein